MFFHSQGFALVVTLSLMVLLALVAVGMLTLSAISLRSSTEGTAMATARANARLALMIAISELQKRSGPDQSITFSSGNMTGEGTGAPANAEWTGAAIVRDHDRRSSAGESNVTWLVSGEQPDPTKELSRSHSWNEGNALVLGTFRAAGSLQERQVLAPVVKIVSGSERGRFAWWVDDQGMKARVDLEQPRSESLNAAQRAGRSQSPIKPLLSVVGDEWNSFTRNSPGNAESLFTLATAALAAGGREIPKTYFMDLTAGGYGLPTNISDGGFKADLSLIFDRSQKNKNFSETYFGVSRPTRVNFNGTEIEQFPTQTNPTVVKDAGKFYLSPTLSRNGSTRVGPNWGILWNYATLWQNVSAEQMPIVGAFPTVWSELRRRDWLPNTNHNVGTYQNDLQHTNSPVAPVVSTLQIGFRMKSELVKAAENGQPALYKAQVEIKPLVGIWNPYNVTLAAAPYRFDWALYPFFRFNYARPNGQDHRLTRLWLRREWGTGSGDMPTDFDPIGGRWFAMETPAVDIRPGETRLFSVTRKIDLRSQSVQRLEPAWSEQGAFVVDLTYKKQNAAGNVEHAVREIPAGHVGWFGDIIMQDTFASGERSPEDNFDLEFPDFDHQSNASSWFTAKSGANVLFRATDLWNSSQDASVTIPEPVVSGWKGGLPTNTTKEKFPIEQIAGDNLTPHIATWAFHNRTTTEIQARSSHQRLRWGLDSNPRAFVAMPRWDGSRFRNKNPEGWYFISNLMGGWHEPAGKGVIGDGNNSFPNRGLIGEGGRAEPEPQISDFRRYSGFNGSSATVTGQANVVVYDVPRSPLISIGQFQHAQLSRYNFDPGFVVGNSYANPRIPLNEIVSENFNDEAGLRIADLSYEANERLWDRFFFSTLGNDYVGRPGASLNSNFRFEDLVSGAKTLSNPRIQFAPLPGDKSIDGIINERASANRAPEAIAARLLVKGAFNVNSTSKTAWKAFLSSMASSELPVIGQSQASWNRLSWENPDGIRFNRFGRTLCGSPYLSGSSGQGPEYWLGWRGLTDLELDQLAEEIVSEVRARGPFRSLAEFVNRNPWSEAPEHQRKGALQAALDRAVNGTLPGDIGNKLRRPLGSHFSDAMDGENESAGHAGYLTQGDILQSLGGLMQVRSDYFRIRTAGEAVDSNGRVVARAWCEAYVQRMPEYIDPADPVYARYDELSNSANREFGRRFQIVSFRWLSQDEI